jgi:hypothetical protein
LSRGCIRGVLLGNAVNQDLEVEDVLCDRVEAAGHVFGGQLGVAVAGVCCRKSEEEAVLHGRGGLVAGWEGVVRGSDRLAGRLKPSLYAVSNRPTESQPNVSLITLGSE